MKVKRKIIEGKERDEQKAGRRRKRKEHNRGTKTD